MKNLNSFSLTNKEMNTLKGGRNYRTVEWADMNGDGTLDKCITVRDEDGNVKRRKIVYK